LGLGNGLYVPVATSKELKPGMVATKGAIAALLAHPRYLHALSDGSKYRINAVHAMSGMGWLTRSSHQRKQSLQLLSLQEVK